MNDYTEEFNAMLKKIFIGCDEYSANIATVSGFNNPYELLRKIMLDIDDLSVKRGNRITSYTETKHLDTYGLSSLSGDIATITCGYAYTINDDKLAASLNYTYEGILKYREEDIPKVARLIYNTAIAHKSELLNFGITEAKFNDLDTMILTYENNAKSNVDVWKQKRMYTAQILAKVKEGKSILDNILDKVVVSFKFSCPELYKMYTSQSHHIIRTNSKRIEIGTIYGFVYVKDEGIPINGVVSIRGNGIDKRSESYRDGEFTFTVPAGKYMMVAERQGFIAKTFDDVIVRSDQDVLLNFELEKSTTLK